MRRSDTLQSKAHTISARLKAALAALLLSIAPLTLLGQAKAPVGQAKAPAQGAQRRTAPASPSTARKQTAQKSSSDDFAWLQDALNNPELMNEVSRLGQRMAAEVQTPAPRTQSRILPRLSDATTFYMAFPNYGQSLHQAQQIFQEELRGSAALRDFLHKNKLDSMEPQMEDGLEKFYEFSEYLGDEVVFTGSFKGQEPQGVLIAEVRKPGLKAFLDKIDQQMYPLTKTHLGIFDPQQLASAAGQPSQGPVALLRQDFMILAQNVATLRDFNAQLDRGPSTFATTVLGKRLAQSYQNGTSTVMAANLQKLLELVPQNPPQSRMMLEKTGFADVKYGLLENRMTGKNSSNQMELVFNGPRRGVASWIAAPAPLGSLSFISDKAATAYALRLKNFAKIFDDVAEIAGPNAFAMLPQMEAQFHVNLRQDVLSKLSGEFGSEFSYPANGPAESTPEGAASMAAQPNFKLILSVSDADGLQRTLKQLLAQAPVQSGERVADGVTFHTITIPAGGRNMEFNYFFLDGYLVIASDRAQAEDAVRRHRGGESLARSSQISADGQPVKASMLTYQNFGPFLAQLIKQLPPGMAAAVPKALTEGQAGNNVFYGYADETSLRATANANYVTEASVALAAAAIAIPNLLRSRQAANQAAAASSLRTVNTAQVTYAVTYPKKGYAPTLAVLGPGNSDCSGANVSPAHACLLDQTLGGPDCTAGKWCEKDGYRFAVRGLCTQLRCSGYVVTATPMNENTGQKSFCSVSDAVIRAHAGAVTAPLTAAECKAWEPL